ncbi:class I glutamine amidotransferase-like protein [Amylocarpus encephaloides]|uniref:Class I glutamine amidotransferase-like protein n=1 Tax=Amylocarpus encephaloides TaxID=45428 RepID=A0A9P8CA59_9HELO|nr:class I glutamine amidotransferase-like protein [Amylocarpus encephaloides]
MTSLPLRIAILECDTPMDSVRERAGGYGSIFSRLLRAGADSLKYPGLSSTEGMQLSSFDVVTKQEYPKLEDVDGILISGSKHNSFDNDPWILKLVEFTKEVLGQERVRVVGVCFGHQIVGRAMRAKVVRSEKGWEISVMAIDLTKKGQEIFGQPSLALHQMHRDIIYECPPEVERLAYTDKCAVHGMYVPRRLITVQGHPEFTGDIMKDILVARHKQGLFDDALFEDALGRFDEDHDGVVTATAFLKFLLEE